MLCYNYLSPKPFIYPFNELERSPLSFDERLIDEMKASMREGNALKVSVIRLLRSSIKNKQIAKGKAVPLTEQDFLETVVSATKQRKDSIEQFKKGGRLDLASKEEQELEILQTFLPQALSPEELRLKVKTAIQESGAHGPKDMGKVMKVLMPQVAGRIDGAVVGQVVKELLSESS